MTLPEIQAELLTFGPEVETLNLLDEHGLISNHCVTISDIAEIDAAKALDWLRARTVPF